MQQAVLASHNPGKYRECQLALADLPILWLPASELGLIEPAETGASFLENALIKARHASRLTGLPALADDSGLCVASLQGAPGIHSKRFAADNHQALLQALSVHSDRVAYFITVLIWVQHADDPAPLYAEGRLWGQIALEARGQQGFGYDPLFWVASHDCTLAELSPAQKNQISSRGQALAQMRDKLR